MKKNNAVLFLCFWIFCITVSTFNLKAYILDVQVLKNPQTHKLVYLFGDIHVVGSYGDNNHQRDLFMANMNGLPLDDNNKAALLFEGYLFYSLDKKFRPFARRLRDEYWYINGTCTYPFTEKLIDGTTVDENEGISYGTKKLMGKIESYDVTWLSEGVVEGYNNLLDSNKKQFITLKSVDPRVMSAYCHWAPSFYKQIHDDQGKAIFIEEKIGFENLLSDVNPSVLLDVDKFPYIEQKMLENENELTPEVVNLLNQMRIESKKEEVKKILANYKSINLLPQKFAIFGEDILLEHPAIDYFSSQVDQISIMHITKKSSPKNTFLVVGVFHADNISAKLQTIGYKLIGHYGCDQETKNDLRRNSRIEIVGHVSKEINSKLIDLPFKRQSRLSDDELEEVIMQYDDLLKITPDLD